MGWLYCILSPPTHSITLSAVHGIQHADFSQQFSHPASVCIITHTISPLALRTGSNVPGWYHIDFLCYHPLAFPAPCNLCRVLQTLPLLSQVLPAHTVMRVVTQILSINTPSVKKKKLSTRPPFLRLSMVSYNTISFFYTQTYLYSILGNQQRRKHAAVLAHNPCTIYLLASLPSFIYDIKCIFLHHIVLTWVKLPPCTVRWLPQ